MIRIVFGCQLPRIVSSGVSKRRTGNLQISDEDVLVLRPTPRSRYWKVPLKMLGEKDLNRATGDDGQRQCAGRASYWRSVVKGFKQEVEQKDEVEEEVFMLSSGSQWCTFKDCLNERAEDVHVWL